MALLGDIIKETLNLAEDAEILDKYGPGIIEEWDSLGHVSLISKLESNYGISIEMDEAMEMETVADIKRILQSKGIKEA